MVVSRPTNTAIAAAPTSTGMGPRSLFIGRPRSSGLPRPGARNRSGRRARRIERRRERTRHTSRHGASSHSRLPQVPPERLRIGHHHKSEAKGRTVRICATHGRLRRCDAEKPAAMTLAGERRRAICGALQAPTRTVALAQFQAGHAPEHDATQAAFPSALRSLPRACRGDPGLCRRRSRGPWGRGQARE